MRSSAFSFNKIQNESLKKKERKKSLNTAAFDALITFRLFEELLILPINRYEYSHAVLKIGFSRLQHCCANSFNSFTLERTGNALSIRAPTMGEIPTQSSRMISKSVVRPKPFCFLIPELFRSDWQAWKLKLRKKETEFAERFWAQVG